MKKEKRYQESLAAKQLKKVCLIVPVDAETKIKDMAAKLREKHLKGLGK